MRKQLYVVSVVSECDIIVEQSGFSIIEIRFQTAPFFVAEHSFPVGGRACGYMSVYVQVHVPTICNGRLISAIFLRL